MISGIGPKDHLNELDIEVLADLPVGHNLQDHPAVGIHVPIRTDFSNNPVPDLNDVQQLYELFVNHLGTVISIWHQFYIL